MTLRALSIDGGGMRGIYSAAYLAALEQAFRERRGQPGGLDIGKAFQLVVGTSTGAIIGCGLAHGIPPDEIVRLYQDHGARIFRRKMPSSIGLELVRQLLRRPAYLRQGEKALRQALTAVFQSTTMGELWNKRRIALAVPAVNMATYRSWVFKTPHDSKTNHRDDNYSLVDICLASSAAPLFRSLAAINPKSHDSFDVFADGGLWANNPVLVTLTEALRMLGDKDDDIEIFALGSCGKPEGEDVSVDDLHRGLTAWKFGGEAAKVSIAAQEFAFDMIAGFLKPHLKKQVRIIRFPSDKIPGAMLQYLDLDETRPEGLNALIRHARQDANMTNSGIQQGTADGLAIEALFNAIPPRAA